MEFTEQYEEVLKDIIQNGTSNRGQEVRTVWKDGEPAYTRAVWVRHFRVRPEDPFPLLRKKFVNPKSLTAEILWIMQKASNKVEDAQELGTNVWNEWENKEGTIGKAYGYQIRNNTYQVKVKDISKTAVKAIGKKVKGNFGFNGEQYMVRFDKDEGEVVNLNQIDYVIHKIVDNPYSRQTVTTLMNPSQFHEMELPPCVWTSHWEVMGGKLQLAVTARSSDTFLGLPFNVAQYALLHRLIAHITGFPIGDFTLTTEDTHLYDRHVYKAQLYLKREEIEGVPEFWIDEEVDSFQEFEYEKNFGWNHYGKEYVNPLKAPIAIGKHEYERLKERGELPE